MFLNQLIATTSTVTSTTSLQPLDLSWVIAAVISIAALISPIAVAAINNRHALKIRQLDIAHEEEKKKMDLDHEAIQRQFEVYYADKRTAFSELLKEAGKFSVRKQNINNYEALHSAVDNAILFCSSNTQEFLISFMEQIDTKIFGGGCNNYERTTYTSLIMALAHQLNQELESTKPVINYKQSKH